MWGHNIHVGVQSSVQPRQGVNPYRNREQQILPRNVSLTPVNRLTDSSVGLGLQPTLIGITNLNASCVVHAPVPFLALNALIKPWI